MPEIFEWRSLAFPEVTEGLTLGGYDWIGLRLDESADGPDWDEVRVLLTDAYRQVAPKFLVAKLD